MTIIRDVKMKMVTKEKSNSQIHSLDLGINVFNVQSHG